MLQKAHGLVSNHYASYHRPCVTMGEPPVYVKVLLHVLSYPNNYSSAFGRRVRWTSGKYDLNFNNVHLNINLVFLPYCGLRNDSVTQPPNKPPNARGTATRIAQCGILQRGKFQNKSYAVTSQLLDTCHVVMLPRTVFREIVLLPESCDWLTSQWKANYCIHLRFLTTSQIG